ncbi:amp-dependent synthetase and ligase [Nannochloropsis gaditana]|uniref:Amp-dependent synthetase and ligase n=1 Tax=Nannochloropsis gaditana TaxID=72520 RepID=W7T287_9STRA|nr:amp-dependent synthetase and ligase [Nannochloropsis gaditana]
MVVSVSQALHHAASSNPSGVAALTYRGPSQACTKTSYNEFLARTLHVVQALSIAFGPHLVAQARVAFLCRNHELLLIYLYAVSELQLIAAPLNTRWGVEEISAALRDCDPAMVVCDADLWPLLRPSLGPESERERDTDGLGKKWEREGKGRSFDREDEGRDPQKQPSMMGFIRGVVLLHARDGGEVEAGVAATRPFLPSPPPPPPPPPRPPPPLALPFPPRCIASSTRRGARAPPKGSCSATRRNSPKHAPRSRWGSTTPGPST